MSELIFPFINFSILVALLAYFLRTPVRGFVSGRHVSLRDEVQQVRTLLVQAQAKYDEFTGRLKAMEAEIVTLREQAKQEGAASKSKILADAQKLSASIVADSRASAQDIYAQLKNELFAEVGNKTMDRAEVLLKERLTGDDRARIRKEFSSQVESVQQ